MKKKNIFIYLMASTLLLSGAVMTSCESMIEEKPFDFIVPEDVEDSDNGYPFPRICEPFYLEVPCL